MTILVENQFGHGAIKQNFIKRKLRRLGRHTAQAGIPFDWTKGYDVEKTDKPFRLQRKNQGSSLSCGGQAGSYFLSAQRQLKGINEDISAKSIYSLIAYDGGGTTVEALEYQLGGKGGNLEGEVPSYLNGLPPNEVFMTDKSWQTKELINSAMYRAGYLPISLKIDLEVMAEATRDFGGCIIEITGQNNGTWLSPYPKPPSKLNSNGKWNHFMYVKGARQVNGVNQIDSLNSWGSDVGYDGVQCFTEEYIKSGYILDAFTFIPASRIQPLPTNQTTWANIIRFFRYLFGYPKIA